MVKAKNQFIPPSSRNSGGRKRSTVCAKNQVIVFSNVMKGAGQKKAANPDSRTQTAKYFV
jgi:hypothetical protein